MLPDQDAAELLAQVAELPVSQVLHVVLALFLSAFPMSPCAWSSCASAGRSKVVLWGIVTQSHFQGLRECAYFEIESLTAVLDVSQRRHFLDILDPCFATNANGYPWQPLYRRRADYCTAGPDGGSLGVAVAR